MGRYRLLVKESAAREIEALTQKKDRQRLVNRIKSLAEAPWPAGVEKLSGRQQKYRIRAGNYRVVYSVDDKENVVQVVKVGHRRDVYR